MFWVNGSVPEVGDRWALVEALAWSVFSGEGKVEVGETSWVGGGGLWRGGGVFALLGRME